MPIPSTNIYTQTLRAEFAIAETIDIPFSRFWDDVSLWAAHKFYNRTLNGSQIVGTTHGLYRDANKLIAYNKGSFANVIMSDLAEYNHQAYSPSFFDVTAIYDMLGRNIRAVDGTFTMYVNFPYTIQGYLYRGEIDPETVHIQTRWNRGASNNVYGGLAFGIPKLQTVTEADVISNTEYDPGQYIEFGITHNTNSPDDFFNIWYCYRNSSGVYSTTDFIIENNYWRILGDVVDISYSFFLTYNQAVAVDLSGTYYGKYVFVYNFTDSNFEDYLSMGGEITVGGVVWIPSGVTVEECNSDGTGTLYTLSVTVQDGYWKTGQIAEVGKYYRISYLFYDDELVDAYTEIDIIDLYCGSLNYYGGVRRYAPDPSGEYFEY